jgi:cytochrome c-type biogenesis protein CcmF
MIPLLLLVPFGPLLAWKRGDIYAASQRLLVAFGAAILVALAAAALTGASNVLAVLGMALAAWLIVGALTEPAFRAKLFQAPVGDSLRRAYGFPRSVWGTMFAHLGLGVALVGIVASTAWQTETVAAMKPGGESLSVAGRTVVLDSIVPQNGPNYSETVARFLVTDARGGQIFLEPAKRIYAVRGTPTTESDIATIGFSQLYFSIGDILMDGTTTVRVYWKPLVTLIWIGPLFMILGGFLSLSDRRLRVGAPRRTREAVVAAE